MKTITFYNPINNEIDTVTIMPKTEIIVDKHYIYVIDVDGVDRAIPIEWLTD